MPTLDEIAKKAGVSIATVSRFINGNVRTSTQNHELIRRAMDELGYIPPKKQNARKNVMVFCHMGNSRIINEIDMRTEKYNVQAVYKFINDSDLMPEQIPMLSELDGVILCNTLMSRENFDRLTSICPVVLGNIIYGYPRSISVTIDYQQAAFDLTAGLIDGGAKRVMYVGDLYQSFQAQQNGERMDDVTTYELIDRRKRLMGYKSALTERGMPVEDGLIFLTFTHELRNRRIYEERVHPRLMEMIEREHPDAVVCSIPVYDNIAWTLDKCGLEIGRDVRFAAFGEGGDDYSHFDHIETPAGRIADTLLMTVNAAMRGEFTDYDTLTLYVGHTHIPKLP